MSARDGRTVAELLEDSDGLAREALLDMSPDRALGMVRGWPQLMQSAAELWAVHPPDPTASVNGDPIAILAAMGRAVGRSFAAGHWPGLGPAWEQIGSNFVHARRLLEQQPVASQAVSTDGPIDSVTARTQILHAIYVAAHATVVALTGYQRDVQHRLGVGARRRQSFVERPTALMLRDTWTSLPCAIEGTAVTTKAPSQSWSFTSFRHLLLFRRFLRGPEFSAPGRPDPRSFAVDHPPPSAHALLRRTERSP